MHTDLLPHHTRNLLPFAARDLLPLVFRWLFPFFANAKAYGQALAIESRKEQALWNSRAKRNHPPLSQKLALVLNERNWICRRTNCISALSRRLDHHAPPESVDRRMC
jgi:hypothetical protein